MSARGKPTVQERLQRQFVKSGTRLLLLLFVLAIRAQGATGEAGLQGVVRDSAGVTQMGALVQVLAEDRKTAATAFTDLHGQYVVANLLPGKYQVRASAALYVPAVRSNLELRTGAHTVVNLTLATLFEAAMWLPSERRAADRTSDDWMWTLRSPVNRPMLRVLEEDGNDPPEILEGGLHEGPVPAQRSTRSTGSLTYGSGVFGASGPATRVTAVRSLLGDGTQALLQAAFAADTGRVSQLATGMQQTLGPAINRTMVRYSSYPQLDDLEALDLGSVQQFTFGETVRAELGGDVHTIRQHAASRVQMQPFVRITGRTSNGWTVQYRMAVSPDLQGFEDLESVGDRAPTSVSSEGSLLLAGGGRHQEFTLARAAVHGSLQVALYHDDSERTAVAGVGALSPRDGWEVDRTSGTFRVLARTPADTGIRARLDTPLTSHLVAALEYTRGQALDGPGRTVISLPLVAATLKPRGTQAAAIAVRGKVGSTRLRASYRWQPGRTVTAVDPYGDLGARAFLSADLRQPLRWAGHLPPGMEATLNFTNLLAQGYRPFLSEDGQTLYLAQMPRALQAGLAFAF